MDPTAQQGIRTTKRGKPEHDAGQRRTPGGGVLPGNGPGVDLGSGLYPGFCRTVAMPRLRTIRLMSSLGSARRRNLSAALLGLFLLPAASGQHAHGGGGMHPAPPMRAPAPPQRYVGGPHVPGGWRPPVLRGPHLGGWLENHQGEPLVQQQNALRQEPGFSRLAPQQQQRMLNRLQQLDAMPPAQRQRWIGRNENFEHLSPQGRQAFLRSAQELRTMDPARKQQVRAAFRVLRDMPPGERDRVLNSPAYRSMYNDHERQVLGNLLSVEPYQPH